MVNKTAWCYYCTSQYHLSKATKRGFIKSPFVAFQRPQDAARSCLNGKNRLILIMELPALHEVVTGNQGIFYIVHKDVKIGMGKGDKDA